MSRFISAIQFKLLEAIGGKEGDAFSAEFLLWHT